MRALLRNIIPHIGFILGAWVCLPLIGSSSMTLAAVGTPPTVTCTDHCQTCLEVEVDRCVQCGIDPNCLGGDPGLSSEFTEMLNAHNEYRSRHCVPALIWSAELAQGAQNWANACSFTHSPEAWTDANGYGENLYWGTGAGPTQAVDWWYDEIKKYNFNAPVWSQDVSHFTQVVWRNSQQLGCGVASCSGFNYWVCRYSPPGNWNASEPAVLAANVLQACPDTTLSNPPPDQTGSTPGQNERGEWSAFATDERSNWGYGAHWANEQIAHQLAIEGCGGAEIGCKVFWTTKDPCVSYAESRAGGYWYAAGGGSSEQQATQNAIHFCQSGTAPANTCESIIAECR